MLTESELFAVGNFDASTIGHLRDALGGGVDAISAAGALDTNFYESSLTVSGTVAYTLAAPTVAGQRKRITCASAAATPLGTVTISSPDTTTGFVCPSTMVFTAAGQSVELIATSGLLWRVRSVLRSGTQTLVIGTTVTAGLVLASLYACSVTGTVSSTGTRALPNGLVAGDSCIVGNSVFASTPVGNINFTGITTAGVAATDLGAIGAATDMVTLQWNGTAWMVITNVGITVT
jgi:hypothetical protein